MDEKNLAGLIHAILFLIASAGVWDQLKGVRQQRLTGNPNPTKGLLPTCFFVSFLATWLIMAVALTRSTMDHWLLWVRYPVLGMSIVLLWNIYFDMKSNTTKSYYWLAVTAALFLTFFIFIYPAIGADYKFVAKTADTLVAIVGFGVMTCKLMQAWAIHKAKEIGANRILRELTILLKEAGVLFYAVILGKEGIGLSIYSVLSLFALIVINLTTFWYGGMFTRKNK